MLYVTSRGLFHDAQLLGEILERQGYEIVYICLPLRWEMASLEFAVDADIPIVKEDLVIFLNDIFPIRQVVRSQARIVLIPNAELLSDMQVRWANAVCDEVWHKCILSKIVYDSFSTMKSCAARQVITGFKSRDMYLPEVKKVWKSKLLHVFGTSQFKGTRDLIQLWRMHPNWPTLVLVGSGLGMLNNLPPNIEFHLKLGEDVHRAFMNRHGIQLCPSSSEGWGHTMVEGMSCGNVVLATAAPPMSEHIRDGETGFLLPLKDSYPYRDYSKKEYMDDRGNNMAQWNIISDEGLEGVLAKVLAMSESELAAIGQKARQSFLKNCTKFEERIIKTIHNSSH
jgi:glycosyltransferase involved in cell wall biosynthesis